MKKLFLLLLVACETKPTPTDASTSASPSASAGQAAPRMPFDAGPRRGECSIGEPKSAVPVADARSVLEGLRPRYKEHFEETLAHDPNVGDASVDIYVQVAANGTVDSVSTSSSDFRPDALRFGFNTKTRGAEFAAPGKPTMLSFRVTCKVLK